MLVFKSHIKKGLSIDLAPLVDMIFLLLIFFLLTSSFLQPAIKINLPSSQSKEMPKQQPIIITVDANQNIYVNLEKVSLGTLKEKIEQKITETGTRAVTFRGDSVIPYELFLKIADINKRAGAKDLHLAHKPETAK